MALVLHPKWLPDPIPVAAFSSAVAYIEPPQVAEQLGRLADNLLANREYVERRDRDQTREDMLVAFRSAAVCIKHPGNSDALDEAIGKFALLYADQTERDHAAREKARRSGLIKVASSEVVR